MALELQNLVKKFGRLRAVDGISLSVPKGSVFGLIGPNGAGKTTTFSMICGWLRPTSGEIKVLGLPPSKVSNLKGKLAALPQDAALPPNTSLESSLRFYARLQGFSASEAKAAAADALTLVGLKEWSKVRAVTLSHGMAKRVGLAQAFLGHPELVLLDEPTAGLDPKSAHHIRDIIRDLKGKATVVISSHNLYELEDLCDRAAVLDHGKVVAFGTMDSLCAADREICITLGAKVAGESLAQKVRAFSEVKEVHFDSARNELVIIFGEVAEDGSIATTKLLKELIEAGALIAAVRRGRGLERRILEIT